MRVSYSLTVVSCLSYTHSSPVGRMGKSPLHPHFCKAATTEALRDPRDTVVKHHPYHCPRGCHVTPPCLHPLVGNLKESLHTPQQGSRSFP